MKRFLSMLAMAVLMLQNVVTSLVYATDIDDYADGFSSEEITVLEPEFSDIVDEFIPQDSLSLVNSFSLPVVGELFHSESLVDDSVTGLSCVEGVDDSADLVVSEGMGNADKGVLLEHVDDVTSVDDPDLSNSFEEIGFQPLSFGLKSNPSLRGDSSSKFGEFLSKWEQAEDCESNPGLGCVNDAKHGKVGSDGVFNEFDPESGAFGPNSTLQPGEVGMWKLVQPTKNSGEYEVNIAIRSERAEVTTIGDAKVCSVVVFDKSGSMKDPQKKWKEARQGAIDFSKSLIENNDKSYVGLVTFSTDATQARGLAHSVLSNKDFGNADGGTNLHAGLIEAGKMLSNDICVDANKYIVVISDGEPTYYVSEKYGTFGCGNKDRSCFNGKDYCNSYRCEEGPKPSEVAIEYANSLRTSGIEIFSIGYETDSTADTILERVSDGNDGEVTHFYVGNTSNVASAFDNIAISVNEAMAGHSGYLTDGLGDTDNLSILGGDGGSVYYEEVGDIDGDNMVYTFLIKVDENAEGLIDTNDIQNIKLEYVDYKGVNQFISLNETASIDWSCEIGAHVENVSGEYVCMDNQQEQKCGEFNVENAEIVNGEFTSIWGENGYSLAPEWSMDGEECTYKCKSGYHTEDGKTCVSNVKEVDCIAGEIANGEYVVNKVEVTWNDNVNNWNETPYCTEIKCNDDYHFDSSTKTCEKNTLEEQKCGEFNVENAEIVNGEFTSIWGENGYSLAPEWSMDGEECTYKCKSGYHTEDGKTCVSNVKEVDCIAGEIANGEYVVNKVEVTWNDNVNNWNETPYCTEIKCNDNYHLSDEGSCEIYKNVVTFDLNGGSVADGVVTMVVVNSGDTVDAIVATRPGYTFKEWTLDGVKFDFSTPIVGNIVLIAQWNKVDNGGGGGNSSGKTKDDCPNGDKSGDFYDGKCDAPGGNSGGGGDNYEELEFGGQVSDKCSVEGSDFSDEVKAAYLYACENDITTIRDINDARLGDFLTRAEMAKIISMFATKELGMIPNTLKDCSNFAASMNGYNQEMKNFMVMSCQLELMGIHTVNYSPIPDFMPNKFVSRAEFGTILSRVLWGNKYEGTNENYYFRHLNSLKENNIISNIDPNIKEYRSWVFLMIYRSVSAIKGWRARGNDVSLEEEVNEELNAVVNSGLTLDAEVSSGLVNDSDSLSGSSLIDVDNSDSENCVSQGGSFEVVQDAEGNQIGTCKLVDGAEIDNEENLDESNKVEEPEILSGSLNE